MRVCKHGCGVKMFCLSRANHASMNLKKVFKFKTRQVYFIYPFLRRLKLGKSLKKSPYFGKHLFAKQEPITRARLRGQDFATGKNFSFNQCLIYQTFNPYIKHLIYLLGVLMIRRMYRAVPHPQYCSPVPTK